MEEAGPTTAEAGSAPVGTGCPARLNAAEPESPAAATERPATLPATRIGLVAGAVGMLCCLGPTLLALVGAVSAATAYTWAYDLYGGYTWWFRLGGLVVAAGLVVLALRRRRVCTIAGARAARYRILLTLAVAVATYGAIYGLTTWAGTFAT